ncbi:Uncharacterised protein [Chryseobacterium nakagawai]|uniref:Uncharacterized protein n=1 Tax=Chryseobacterium nakagawai TaxID=1241982 RepID=A0AAD1DQZ5_CHRNA|nr:hypothetical protein [Chryseobacterium nakagawai]AZA90349.1 hypothetical protein EG343_06820 [Chryseobacterium nakagawai]VEH21835.1 Uncharacterised protein [Chryseobacterium nakagawai]
MSDIRIHMKTYKAIIMMLILVFSLSPCSVKRNVLDIFDIQYISGLNKVKITSGLSLHCDTSTTSSKISISKAEAKLKYKESSLDFNANIKITEEDYNFFNEYSGHTTGNSPPKYILFKRLKLNLA